MKKKISLLGAVVIALVALAPQSAGAIDLTETALDRPGAEVQMASELPSEEKILALGKDGIARTVVTKDNGAGGENTLSNELKLMPGDRVEISEDGLVASVFENDGSLLGEFVSPTVNVEGEDIQGQFEFENGNLLTTFDDDVTLPFACWQGTTAKWTWRVAAGLVCGALGVVTVPGGFACGLGAAGAEDAMNIDGRAC